MIDREAFITGFIDCLLWSETDQSDDAGGEPLDASYDRHDIEPEALAEIREDCLGFIEANEADLIAYCERMGPWEGTDDRGYGIDPPEARAGHDFCLTRNGHGAGFWDRGLGELGDRLTEASKPYSTLGLMPVSGGKLASHN